MKVKSSDKPGYYRKMRNGAITSDVENFLTWWQKMLRLLSILSGFAFHLES